MNDSEECFAYAEHLHQEHGRLNRLLLDIGHEMAQLGRPDTDRELRKRLETRVADLCDQLNAHYAEEEEGGCLEEAVTRCPSLAADIKTILEEHPALHRRLSTLLAQLSDPAAPPAEIQANWRIFYTMIQCHEAAETRLLRMAFGAETADWDVEGDE